MIPILPLHYQVSQKKWMIAKSYFWGPLETVFSLLWYLEHLFRILGLVHVLKERFLCPYNVPYSPYKPYQSRLGLSFWLWLWLKLSLEVFIVGFVGAVGHIAAQCYHYHGVPRSPWTTPKSGGNEGRIKMQIESVNFKTKNWAPAEILGVEITCY